MQKMSNSETKRVVAIDRESLFQGGLLPRFDCNYLLPPHMGSVPIQVKFVEKKFMII